MTVEKIAERVRKLLALAGNNPSEAEAISAMERASSILAEHNLETAEVGVSGSTDTERVKEERDGDSPRQTWARIIWDAVARLNFCFHTYQTPRPDGGFERLAGGILRNTTGHRGDRHFIIGTRGNVAVTIAMATYLVETVERLAREYEEARGVHAKHAFKLGCAARLADRLRELKQERMRAKAEGSAAVPTATTLPVLYASHEKANTEFYCNLHGRMPSGGSRLGTSNVGAYERGRDAGGGIGLHDQVRRGGAPLAITKRGAP
jgi:Protein of unknown function (DUF2786)